MPFCIYCGKNKKIEQFSDEHVIPKAIGGNLEPTNPFIIDEVCNRCNNISGIFIDEPFIKSWFTQNNRADLSFKYIDLDKDLILPLTYFGKFEDLNYEEKVCEFWLGPTGDQIFHFHKPYPEISNVPPVVGIPTHAKRKNIDHGFAFIFIRSNNPVWHKPILFSFVNKFKKSTLYLGNGPKPEGDAFSEIPEELKELHTELKNRTGSAPDKKKSDKHKLKMSLGLDYGDRFLAKLALGLGSILLNDSYKKSKSAKILREFMWTKSNKKREKILLHGTNFIGETIDNDLKKYLSWPGGHFLYFLPDKNRGLILYTNFYEKQDASILITSNPEHWKETTLDNEGGVVYIITPSLQSYAGPISFASYISHKIIPDYTEKKIESLEEKIKINNKIPPFEI